MLDIPYGKIFAMKLDMQFDLRFDIVVTVRCDIKNEIGYDNIACYNTLAQTNFKSRKIPMLQEYQCSVIFQNSNFYANLNYSLWMALASK